MARKFAELTRLWSRWRRFKVWAKVQGWLLVLWVKEKVQ
jgi:hypothetical protein